MHRAISIKLITYNDVLLIDHWSNTTCAICVGKSEGSYQQLRFICAMFKYTGKGMRINQLLNSSFVITIIDTCVYFVAGKALEGGTDCTGHQ